MKTLRWRSLIRLLLGLLCLCWVDIVQAADFSGTWNGIFYTEQTRFREIEITISQNVNSLSGSYVVPPDNNGTFTGTVSGNTATVALQLGTACTGLGKATLNGDGILSFTGYTSGCSAEIKVEGKFSRNQPDYKCWMNLHKHLKKPGGTVEGNIWAHCTYTYADVDSVSLVTPIGKKVALAWDTDNNDWILNHDMPDDTHEANFPDGIYYYDIRFKDGSRGNNFNGVTSSFPSEFPSMIQPAVGAAIDETKELTVSWAPWLSINNGIAPYIWFGAGAYSHSLPGATTQTTVPAYSYADDSTDDIGVTFYEGGGYAAAKGMTTFTDIWTGAGHYLNSPMMGLIKGTSPSAVATHSFMSVFEAHQIKTAALQTPKGEIIPFEQDDLYYDFWKIFIPNLTASDVAGRFPDGDYQIDITFLDNSTTTQTLTLSGSYPTAIPVITSPLNNETKDPSTDLTINWEQWLPLPSDTDMIRVMLQQVDNTPANGAIIDNGYEIWGEMLPADQTSVTIPSSHLFGGQTYQVVVLFFKTNGKATASVSYFVTQKKNLSQATPPASLTVPAADADGSYRIRWTASATSGTTYVLQEATNPAFTAGLRTAYTGTALSRSISGRKQNQTYYYRIKAIKTGYTDSIWTLASGGCAVPGSAVAAATGSLVVPSFDTDGAYQVSWGASATDGANYLLQEATDPTFTAGLRTAYYGADLFRDISGRSQSTTYYYRVRVVKAGFKDSAWRVAVNSCPVPGASLAARPALITVPVSDADGNYTVSWSASATAGVTYVLEEATNSAFTSARRIAHLGNILSANITGRSPGKTYYYRIKAIRRGYRDSSWRAGTNGCLY